MPKRYTGIIKDTLKTIGEISGMSTALSSGRSYIMKEAPIVHFEMPNGKWEVAEFKTQKAADEFVKFLKKNKSKFNRGFVTKKIKK